MRAFGFDYDRLREAQRSVRWTEQIDTLEGATDLDRVLERVNCLVRRQRYTEARAESARAVELELGARSLGNLAMTTALCGDPQASLSLYDRALELGKYDWLYTNYAEDLVLCEHFEEAMKACEAAIALNRNHGPALAVKARILFRIDLHRAWSAAQDAQACGDYPTSLWEIKGLIAARLGKRNEARRSLTRFIQEADPETLWENDLTERIVQAQAELARL